VALIKKAFPQGEYHTYAAGHGFNCMDRASFDAAAAHAAFARVREFIARYVG
jgi:carboxymethylenebutenolidase